MLRLVIKDIILQKKTLLFNIAYGFILFFAFQSPVFAPMLYAMGSMLIAYMMILGACAYDGTSNSDILLNSLPVKQSHIVISRYLSVFVFMSIGLCIMAGEGILLKTLGFSIPPRLMNWGDIIGVIISLGFIISIYLPIYFKFGYIKSRLFHLVLFFTFFALPALAMNIIKISKLKINKKVIEKIIIGLSNNQPDWFIMIISITSIILVMLLSCSISYRLYKGREF